MTIVPRRFVQFFNRRPATLGGVFVFIVSFAAYVATLASAPVPGDPSEYTFIPWILGIAHPPGYAFYTLLAALWQRLVPIGTVAYRTHLLAATAGATSATLVYFIILTILNRQPANQPTNKPGHGLAAVFGALSFAFATDVWQHSLHANAHIITLLLATTSLFLLLRWRATHNDRWLYAFALIAGLSPTQHPLLVIAFPAYAAFILIVQPRILREVRALLASIACFLLGLSVFLYYPLRSPTTPFGVSDIRSWDSFVHFVSAEGLRVNLFSFGLADQPARFSVFVNLLQLQYPLITLLLAVVGWIILARRHWRVAVLVSVAFVSLYAFVINTVQDVMAYLMLPFMLIAILIGLGASAALSIVFRAISGPRLAHAATLIAAIALIGWPIASALPRAPRISLRDYRVGAIWAGRVYIRFAGRGGGAFLLTPWEALTPLWVEQYVNDRPLASSDVTLVYVAADSANPWLDSVFAHFDRGPVYLADYRREVVEGGLFRLRPDGGSPPLWQVVAPGDTSLPLIPTTLNASAEDRIEVLAYALDRETLRAGQTAYLTLAMRAPVTPTHILMPYALVGDRAYRWTTDSRLLTIDWLPGEVIVERYEITVPFSAPHGKYPIRLGVTDLTESRDLHLSGPQTSQLSDNKETVSIGALNVLPPILAPNLASQTVLADFGAQIALVGASASANGQSVKMESGAWTQPLVVRPGQSIQVWLDWLALQPPLDNYKVFVHLITPGEQLAAPEADFYTPLGGAFPTQLWIPKWIEGQRVSDPYTLTLPPDLPAGDYRIQVGLYGLTSNRRVYLIDPRGNLAGDRVILGPVTVPPHN